MLFVRVFPFSITFQPQFTAKRCKSSSRKLHVYIYEVLMSKKNLGYFQLLICRVVRQKSKISRHCGRRYSWIVYLKINSS